MVKEADKRQAILQDFKERRTRLAIDRNQEFHQLFNCLPDKNALSGPDTAEINGDVMPVYREYFSKRRNAELYEKLTDKVRNIEALEHDEFWQAALKRAAERRKANRLLEQMLPAEEQQVLKEQRDDVENRKDEIKEIEDEYLYKRKRLQNWRKEHIKR